MKYVDLEKNTFTRERPGVIRFYEDDQGEFRWRIEASNGRKIANCGEGYKNKKDCLNGLESVKWHIDKSEVIEEW